MKKEAGFLGLKLKVGDEIRMGDDISVHVKGVTRSGVQLVFQAPKSIPIRVDRSKRPDRVVISSIAKKVIQFRGRSE